MQAGPIISSTPEEGLVNPDNFTEFAPGGESGSDEEDLDHPDAIHTLESLENASFHSVKSTLTAGPDESQVIDGLGQDLYDVNLACGGTRIVTEAEVHRPDQDDGYALVSPTPTPQLQRRPLPPVPSGHAYMQPYQHGWPQPPLRRSTRSYRLPRHPVCEVVVNVHQNTAAPPPVQPSDRNQGVDPDLLSRTLSHKTVARINLRRLKSDCQQLVRHAGDFLFRRTR